MERQSTEPEASYSGGWDEEPYQGTLSDPIVIKGDDGEEEVESSLPRRKPKLGRPGNPILINSDEEDEDDRRGYKSRYSQGASTSRQPKLEPIEEPRSYFCSTSAVPSGTDDFGGEFSGEAEAYKYLDSYFNVTDWNLEASPSDPDYQPSGKKIPLPGFLRRTGHNKWWKPGKFTEK